MKGGTAAMADTRYRRGKNYSADMAAFARMMAMDNASQLELLQARLGQALREEVTDRQRQMLFLYYAQGLNMREIAQALGVEQSTVSRTMKRGEDRLRRCLQYSGDKLLTQAIPRKRPGKRH